MNTSLRYTTTIQSLDPTLRLCIPEIDGTGMLTCVVDYVQWCVWGNSGTSRTVTEEYTVTCYAIAKFDALWAGSDCSTSNPVLEAQSEECHGLSGLRTVTSYEMIFGTGTDLWRTSSKGCE